MNQQTTKFKELGVVASTQRTPANHGLYFTPNSCSKFLKCNAPICPLDADWRKRVLLNVDPTCYYLTESVKHGAEAVFQRAGMKELYVVIVRATPDITARHARIRRALERAKLKCFRMTRFQTNVMKTELVRGAHE